MQEFIDPTIVHELQANQDEILVFPTYWFPTLGDLIMASNKVMNNVCSVALNSWQMIFISLWHKLYIFHTYKK
jgi:hypothetical protein